MTNSTTHSTALPDSAKQQRIKKLRRLKDKFTTRMMGIGGTGVIIAIVLIFFYLLYVVYPLFIPADMHKLTSYPLPEAKAGKTLALFVEEQNHVGLRLTDQAQAVFFDVEHGQPLETSKLPLPKYAKPISMSAEPNARNFIIYGLDNGEAIIARHKYRLDYSDNKKTVIPELVYPFGAKAIEIDENRHPLQIISFRSSEEKGLVAAITADDRLVLVQLTYETELGDSEDEEIGVDIERVQLENIQNVSKLLINTDQRLLFVAQQSGDVVMIDISEFDSPQILETKHVVASDATLSYIDFLTGEISLLVGDNHGRIQQWFPVKTESGLQLQQIRKFDSGDAAIAAITTEQRRKGFAAINNKGELGIYHSTARRTLLFEQISEQPLTTLAVSPRANRILTEDNTGNMQFWQVENEHPEISWSVLWDKVWYESYPEPSYTWQSSSASNDFEPKFSLVPLAFGTLKAAFYAMLFAVPLAIMGAIFTAYFMSPKMRTIVKPTIEIMEALPTVILGFLAGLWLAPAIEEHLAGIFSLLLLMPVGVLLFAYGWQKLPINIRNLVPDGWQAALLVPALLLTGYIAIALGHPLENLFFGGDLQGWFKNTWGMDYDQRNSLVVGIAMGVAVIPTIFSITEDAIFSVPKHLTFGSLALGATPWQTLSRVVILTASPGIFSAVMIGLGRAIGETMIVLMATGNTPVMDMSIFQGMRTLSANIAVEMPESEVASTHYRILFLAALVLFGFTFIFNTVAEIVRQRLRVKYSSL